MKKLLIIIIIAQTLVIFNLTKTDQNKENGLIMLEAILDGKCAVINTEVYCT